MTMEGEIAVMEAEADMLFFHRTPKSRDLGVRLGLYTIIVLLPRVQRKATEYFMEHYFASSTHFAAASSNACWAGLTPVKTSWIASRRADEASL